jgi:GntR family transcriptional regulator
MNYVSINKLSSKPIYVQLADSFRFAIKRHQLKQNDHLPTEEELCKKFEISNIVVKQAYQLLSEEGLITRIQGKGTFVRSVPVLDVDFHDFKDIENRFRALGTTKSINLIDIVSDHDLAFSALLLEEGEEAYRLILTSMYFDVPVYSVELIMPTQTFPKLESVFQNPNASVVGLAKSFYGLNISSSTHDLSMENLNNADAKQLHVEPNDAAYVIRSVYFDDQKKPVFYTNTIYPSEYLLFNSTVVIS